MGIAYILHGYKQNSWATATLKGMKDIACYVRRHRGRRHIRSECHKRYTRERQSTVKSVGGLREEKDRAQSNGKIRSQVDDVPRNEVNKSNLAAEDPEAETTKC